MESVAAFPVKMEVRYAPLTAELRVSHAVVGEKHTAEDWTAVCSADWQTHPSQGAYTVCVCVCVEVGAVSLSAWESAALI